MSRTANAGTVRCVAGLLFALVAGGAGCANGAEKPSGSNLPGQVTLPEIRTQETVSLGEAIYRRKSVRHFSGEPLELSEAGMLLWAAGGKGVDGISGATRTVPSAGALYSLVYYLAVDRVKGLEKGIYRYGWKHHTLTQIQKGPVTGSIAAATFSASFTHGTIPCCVIITAQPSRTAARYGDRGVQRYLSMAAGSAAQNVHLQAAGLGLGTYIIGAFDDMQLMKALGRTNSDEMPLLIMPVGRVGD